ncbi:hypothetical protein KUTeg_001832 [Tegillarca granosa]|uniref:Potassium voltage-gated channel subfamily H member 2 n=1 Tax=Tegillarca granosa TaxID=220873 RepID=A0ABQ9FVC5_TEGGR|nr:hypothetical protein KUTeg_001832 [Tegillarca granosa]
MTNRKGFLTQQNTFLDTIATKFDGTHSNFVLGNAQAIGFPIVYCSDGFCELTGYARAHVMGKSCACKFLYGKNTEEKDKQKIDDALENKEELKTEMSLKCRNGETFMCLLDIVPIKNEKSQVVLFLVSHKDVSKESNTTPNDSEKESSEDSDDELDENFRPPNGRCRSSDLPSDYNYGRRRSRAVLYHLSGQFDKQNKAKSKLQQLNKLTGSISTKMPEYKVQEVKKSRFVIAHYGIFKIGWDWLILLCTFYTAIMVPYNASFITVDGNYRSSIYSDVVVESLFIIDIILNFRTSFVNKSGQVVYDGKLVALNYMRDRYSQYSAIVVTLLMCMFALSAHWLACVWYAIGYGELESNPPNWTVGWLHQLSMRIEEPINSNKTNKPNVMTSYLTALYFTCSSLTSVGFGNVSANTDFEKIFSVCAMLIGVCVR